MFYSERKQNLPHMWTLESLAHVTAIYNTDTDSRVDKYIFMLVSEDIPRPGSLCMKLYMFG